MFSVWYEYSLLCCLYLFDTDLDYSALFKKKWIKLVEVLFFYLRVQRILIIKQYSSSLMYIPIKIISDDKSIDFVCGSKKM